MLLKTNYISYNCITNIYFKSLLTEEICQLWLQSMFNETLNFTSNYKFYIILGFHLLLNNFNKAYLVKIMNYSL